MFKHILVPLDGSRLAESALGIAASLARRLGASLTLFHVIEAHAPSEVHRERHLVSSDEASDYLDEVAHLSMLSGAHVSTHVHETEAKDVAASVREHSTELTPDLIVMCTHGAGGARRLLFGDMAQQVIAHGKTPVLVVHPPKEGGSAVHDEDWRNILVPIDGNPSHEASLGVAADMAQSLHCRLNLLIVVPTLGRLAGLQGAVSLFQPATTRIKLELDNEGALAYVEGKAEQLQGRGIHCRSQAARGEPSAAILKAARQLPADLVVIGTHGKAGTEAFWAGSVAAKVIAKTRLPLLLVPVEPETGVFHP